MPGELKVYSFDGSWHADKTICKHIHKRKGYANFQRGKLVGADVNTWLILYTFNPHHDTISRTILGWNSFELTTFKIIKMHLDLDLAMDFVDIGSNIGVFSIQVASLGRSVLAVEVSRDCVERMCASIDENKFHDKITIINNALIDGTGEVQYVKTKTGDYGFHFIETNETRLSMFKNNRTSLYATRRDNVNGVSLDMISDTNILQVNKPYFIKMDAEGIEHVILQGSRRFFESFDIRGMLIEWDKHFNSQTGDVIIRFMTKRHFEPYECTMAFNKRTGREIDPPCEKLNQSDIRKNRLNLLWLPSTRRHSKTVTV